MAEVQKILVSEILPNIDRKEGGLGDIEKLAQSIKEIGLINPITVRRDDGNKEHSYTVIAGRRRLEAVKSLGLKEVEAVIYGKEEAVNDEEIALSENVNRLDLHPLDEGVKYKALFSSGKTIEDLCKTYDRSESHIYQRMKLCDLIDPLKELFRGDRMSIAQAAKAASMPKKVQQNIYEQVKDYNGYGAISGWAVNNAIRNSVKQRLNLINCAACKTCSKRTHYSDNNLFPELNGEEDYCLDTACYEKVAKGQMEKEIKKFLVSYTSAEKILIATPNDYFNTIAETIKRVEDCDVEVFYYDNNSYAVIDYERARAFLSAGGKDFTPLVRLLPLSKDKEFIISKDDYKKYFDKREITEDEKLVIDILPDEYKAEAKKTADKHCLLNYSIERQAQKTVIYSLLKKEFLKPNPTFYLSDNFFDYLYEYCDKDIFCDAFKMMTGTHLNSLKDTKRFNFTHIDFLNLFFYAFIFLVIQYNDYSSFEEIINVLGLDIREAKKILNEELKTLVIENLKKDREEEAEDDNLTGDSFQSEDGDTGDAPEENEPEDEEVIDIEPFRKQEKRICSI